MNEKPTFEDLKNDPFQRKLIERLDKTLKGGITDAVKSYIVDLATSSSHQVDQISAWIKLTTTLAAKLARGELRQLTTRYSGLSFRG